MKKNKKNMVISFFSGLLILSSSANAFVSYSGTDSVQKTAAQLPAIKTIADVKYKQYGGDISSSITPNRMAKTFPLAAQSFPKKAYSPSEYSSKKNQLNSVSVGAFNAKSSAQTQDSDSFSSGYGKQRWVLVKGKTLRQNLAEWGVAAGWSVVWKVQNTDFKITQDAAESGSFEDALTNVLMAYGDGAVPISAKMHDKNRVVEIVSRTGYKRNTLN